MSWNPDAERMELQPESDDQPAITPTQFIAHSIAAPWTPGRIYAYWRDSTNLESHFGVGYDGSLAQFIGTQTRADANMHANRRPDGTGAVSAETASNLQHTDPWTPEQVETLIKLGVWLHREHGLPLRICRTHDDPGYGYHRLFPEWSAGGTACPGDVRVRQFLEEVFPGIVARAAAAAPVPPTPDAPAPPAVPAPAPAPAVARYQVTIGGLQYGYGAHGDHVTRVGQALVATGHGGHYRSGPGPDWTDADTENYADYQHSLGYGGTDADGVPGEASLRRLLGGLLPGETPPFPGADRFRPGQSNEYVRLLGEQLVRRGFGQHYSQGPGPTWTESDRRNVADFQRSRAELAGDADGYPGPRTWAELFR
jgi:hypothetical protein